MLRRREDFLGAVLLVVAIQEGFDARDCKWCRSAQVADAWSWVVGVGC